MGGVPVCRRQQGRRASASWVRVGRRPVLVDWLHLGRRTGSHRRGPGLPRNRRGDRRKRLLQKALTKATVWVRSHDVHGPHISSPYSASIREFLFRVSVVPASEQLGPWGKIAVSICLIYDEVEHP